MDFSAHLSYAGLSGPWSELSLDEAKPANNACLVSNIKDAELRLFTCCGSVREWMREAVY